MFQVQLVSLPSSPPSEISTIINEMRQNNALPLSLHLVEQLHPELWPTAPADPLYALLLGVHHKSPALAGGQDGRALCRHPIVWQALVVPGSHGGIVWKHEDRVQVVCLVDGDLEHTERQTDGTLFTI